VSESLRSQLLKAGLGKAPEPKASKPKAPKPQPKAQAKDQGKPPPKPKARRKSALSQTLREQAKLIIEQRRLPRGQGACAYHFLDGKKVRKLYVTEAQRDGLAAGAMVLVRHGAGFEVIEEKVAEKIRELDDRLVLPKPQAPGEDDPAYADHPIPDDLDW
jgi:uncharacterized protein YaiL (DUF2058 family)